ncbi:MAG: hypothetical protein HQL21_05185 [Candidatus Omnitrophica bacterium]|nr:hypothetical protein [Candidatus Omnitrophota bacterium]
MIIVIIFLFFIVLGLAAFFFFLMKELKGQSRVGEPSLAKNERPTLFGAAGLSSGEETIKNTTVSVFKNGTESVKEDMVDKLTQKCLKLEQLLDEKNHTLARLEGEVQSEQSHRREFESLKDILLRQIEDVKAQNRKLKDDLAKVLQARLQPLDKVAGEESDVQQREASVVEASAPASKTMDLSSSRLVDIFELKNKR